MKITVAICTWNRAKLLDQTLAQMRSLQIPEGVTWNLLVVNNNCTDDTDAVIAEHAGALPLQRLLETKQGLSNARNCAVEHATGDLLVWTDDDVLVEPDWLAEYAKAADAYPDAGYFGGTVDPWFEVEPPRWVRRDLAKLGGPFAIRQYGPMVRPLGEGEEVFGANMAFRLDALRGNQFDPALGRIGSGMLSGDETELLHRLRKQGRFGVWVGSARVRHFIPAARMTAGYVWKYFHGLGRTTLRVRGPNPTLPRLFGAERWVVRRYVLMRARSLALTPGRGSAWLNSFIAAAVARGMLDESREAARAPA
jgi:glycosyltransferase involved in cell wall biosynthesis